MVSHGTICRRTTQSSDPTSGNSTPPPRARDRLVIAWNPSFTHAWFVGLTTQLPFDFPAVVPLKPDTAAPIALVTRTHRLMGIMFGVSVRLQREDGR